ncbi:MAG: hypothetical protein HRT69_16970 [Flavobacteriaceae bacterium]|nr:hypothetical protein [Flavobacteriaceae bacterium]
MSQAILEKQNLVDEEVQNLGASWRNFLSQQMGLNPKTFQLAIGGLGLQTSDNLGLFLMSDGLPPSSAVKYYSPDNTNSRASAYGMLLNGLLPEGDPNGIQNALGNNYTSWIEWQQANPPVAGDTYLGRFKQWGLEAGIDPGTLVRGEAAILQSENSSLIKALNNYMSKDAQQTFAQPGQPSVSAYIYTATSDNAIRAINAGQSLNNINFDSSTESSKIDKVFIDGSASGFYSIFSAAGSGSFEKLNKKASESKFTITGRIGKFATLVTGPGGNWYSSAEVNRAATGKDDNTIWNPNTPSITWGSMFEQPEGQLCRFMQNLVLVSDYDITVTSHASYTKEEYQEIKTKASAGVWPFFKSSGSFNSISEFKHNENSTLSINHKLNKGLIQIWGINIGNQSI